jgi:hypothetical protein
MERLFSPCTRYRDLEESRGSVLPPEGLRELDLNVSIDDAERDFTYADLHTMLGNENTIAWLTPHAAIVSVGGNGILYRRRLNECCFHFTVDSKEKFTWARSSEALWEICDVVLRLVAASVVHSVVLHQLIPVDGVFINTASLAYLMEQCQSLKTIRLQALEFDENHCRLLGTCSRPDLRIELKRCKFTRAGACALAEVLGRNQGPTRLDYCDVDPFHLANELHGISRLISFRTYFSRDFDIHNQQLLAIADAIRENKGLIEYGYIGMNGERWGVICDSFKTHPTLEVLDVSEINIDATTIPAVITSRVQALFGMMEVNTSIHTIDLRYQYSGRSLSRDEPIPSPRSCPSTKSLEYVPCQGSW